MIKLIIADDHKIVRNGIRALLLQESDIQVIGEAHNGSDVLKLITDGINPDIILSDIHMPEMDGIELARALQEKNHPAKIIIMSMVSEDKFVTNAFSVGASGYLFKNVSAEELAFSIRHVAATGRYICTDISLRMLDKLMGGYPDQPAEDVLPLDISPREIEILQFISDGLTNEEIAEKIFSSKRTVETNRHALIQKFSAKNTAQLIKFALQRQLIT